MRYLFLAIFLLPALVFAESIQVNYTEPAGTGFTDACVYACVQYNTSVCTCLPNALRGCKTNQNGATAEATNFSFIVPIKDGQLPVCVNYAVTTKDSATGNESALVLPAAGPHVFTAP
jgi:hypothetical protein